MKRLAVVALVSFILVVVGSASAQELKQLAHADRLRVAADAADDPRPWLSGLSFGVDRFNGKGVRIHLTTTPPPWSGPDRDFTSAAWLSAHPRYSAGTLTVKLFRHRVISGIESFCATQTLSLPAQPNQDVVAQLDLTRYTQADAVYFEIWPAFDYRVEVFDPATGWSPFTSFGAQAQVIRPSFGQVQVETGACN